MSYLLIKQFGNVLVRNLRTRKSRISYPVESMNYSTSKATFADINSNLKDVMAQQRQIIGTIGMDGALDKATRLARLESQIDRTSLHVGVLWVISLTIAWLYLSSTMENEPRSRKRDV